MANKELRKMTRKDLLEILVEQQRIIEQLESKVDEYESDKQRNQVLIDRAGSIADAVITINDVFGKAQTVADQYLCEIEKLKERTVQQTQAECEQIIAAANKKAESIIGDAETMRREKLKELYVIYQKINNYLNTHPNIKEHIENTGSLK